MLKTPPFFARELASKLWQLTTVDTNSDVSELRGVISNHLSTALLIQLLSCVLRRRHVGEKTKCAVLTIIHACIAIWVITHNVLHALQFVELLLTSLFRKHCL